MKFINPYNFLSLKDKKTVVNGKKRGTLTGCLEVKITTKSPLFIPDTENVEDNGGHRILHFFSTDPFNNNYFERVPVIPGSSIRGVIRSMHEMLNNSCLSTVNSEQSFFQKATNFNAIPYILWHNGSSWVLLKASKRFLKLATEKVFRGKREFLALTQEQYKNKIGVNLGSTTANHIFSIYLSEKNSKGKRKIVCFYANTEDNPIKVTEEELENFKRVVARYKDNTINKHIALGHTGYSFYEESGETSIKLKTNEWYPIYVWTNDGKRYLSPAQKGTIAMKKRMKHFISNYIPCENEDNICETCNVFGYVNDDNGKSSRVRFGDATMIGFDSAKAFSYYKKFDLKALLSPHVSNIEMYTHRSKFNNSYFFGDKYKIFNQDCDDVAINGRKFYWHHSFNEKLFLEKSGNNDLNMTVYALDKGKEFKEKIYYENLTEDELQKLIFAINLLDENSCHKLGAAKPFGFGSVKLSIIKHIRRNIVIKDNKIVNYQNVDDKINLGNPYDMDDVYYKKIKFLCDFTALKEFDDIISYPFAIDDFENKSDKGFEWFAYNKNNSNFYYLQMLKVLDGDIIRNHDKVTMFTNKKPPKPNKNNGLHRKR